MKLYRWHMDSNTLHLSLKEHDIRGLKKFFRNNKGIRYVSVNSINISRHIITKKLLWSI